MSKHPNLDYTDCFPGSILFHYIEPQEQNVIHHLDSIVFTYIVLKIIYKNAIYILTDYIIRHIICL